jgi:hypothetical protein
MKSNLRHNVFKIPLNDDEDSLLRKLCTAKGMQCAPFVRGLINKATSAHVRRREGKREWPRAGHVGVMKERRNL